MRRSLFAWFVLQSTSCLFAQDAPPSAEALAAGKQRLVAALQKTAALNDVAFAAIWEANDKKKQDGQNEQVLGMLGRSVSGKASGSWHDGLEHFVFDGGNGDEIWRAGGRMVARDVNREWCPRKNRFADGNSLSYPADVAALLRGLAAMDLAVVQRSPGSIDDRPVEIVTVTLNPDQVTELLRGEHVPESLLQNPMAAFQIAIGGGGGGGAPQRPEAQKPQATVDIAIAFDPGTSLVQELRFRSWMKDDGNGRNFFIRGGGAGAVRVVGGNAQNDDEDDDKDAAAGPMKFDNGLPVRPRKKTYVMDFSLRIDEHGTKKAPELDAAAKKLLGR